MQKSTKFKSYASIQLINQNYFQISMNNSDINEIMRLSKQYW